MENINQITKVFTQFLDAVQCLQEALNVPMTEALTESFDNLENHDVKVEMGAPDPDTVELLKGKYASLNYDQMSSKQKVEVYNLLTLKAISDEDRDANQMPTPPILATVITLFMSKLLPKKEQTILDPALGTGSLLYSVVKQLASQNHSQNPFKLVGIDHDEDILNLADVGAHLNGLDIDLYCQDALLPWQGSKPEVIVSDLPVGYYVNDENAGNFELRTKEGHSYAHVLLTEQIVKNLAPDGYAFLLVPNSMISGKLGADFMPWLANKVHLQAIVQLPEKLFQTKVNHKSLLIFQNHGQSQPPREVLLTRLDDLKNEESLVGLNIKLNEWYTEKGK